MPSDSDRRFADVMAALTGPGGLLEAAADDEGRMIVPGMPNTLAGLMRWSGATYGEAEALVCGDERLSYAALDALSEAVARALAGGWGIARGDRVGIAMRNCPAWIVAYMAVAKAGAIATLVNGWWTPAEMSRALTIATPRLMIADADRAARIAMPAGRMIVLPIEAPVADAFAPLLVAAAGALPQVDGDDDATLLFTSGSTGGARGVVSTHRAVMTATCVFASVTAGVLGQYHGGDRANLPGPPAALVAVPLFHVTGEVPLMLASLLLARKLVLMPRWDAGEALRLIAAERISYFVGVPTMSLELMRHPDRDRFDTSSLLDIAAGGAPRPPEHVAALAAAFASAHPMLGYGLTETNAVGCTNVRDRYIARPGSTGRPQAPFVEVAVFGEDGKPVASDAVGEIGIRSAANMRGYWNDPVATAATLTADGYVLTGDLGYLDADGYLFITDRAKDIIIRGGENIGVQEVEQALYAHPAIAEACVFGVADARLGEVPVAVIWPRPDMPATVEELRAYLGERLARFKLPAHIRLSDAPLPRLGTGKIDRRGIRLAYGAAAAD